MKAWAWPLWLACGVAGAARAERADVIQLRHYLEERDYLGARVLTRRIADTKVNASDWIAVRELFIRYPGVGYDFMQAWDSRRPLDDAQTAKPSAVDRLLGEADDQLPINPARAFEIYERVARAMRKKITRIKDDAKAKEQAPPAALNNLEYVYPYALHGIARALYALGRFDEAYAVYTWFNPSYARFRQTLFERMWSAFMAGRVDNALGAIASQRSDYFSDYLEPETYIIQIYLYKKLCRDDDFRQVLKEVKAFRKLIKSGQYDYLEWARTDVANSSFLPLLIDRSLPNDTVVTRTQREAEREAVRGRIRRAFEADKTRLIDGLESAMAYGHLASASGADTRLKPVDKLPDRATLFAQNLEIWPADKAEDWIDEVGHHRFLGESLCARAEAAPAK